MSQIAALAPRKRIQRKTLVLPLFFKQAKIKFLLLLLLTAFAKASSTFEINLVSSNKHLNTCYFESLSPTYIWKTDFVRMILRNFLATEVIETAHTVLPCIYAQGLTHFLFYKNIIFKNIEAEMRKIFEAETLNGKTGQKTARLAVCPDVDNISARSYVCRTRISCLQYGSKITFRSSKS